MLVCISQAAKDKKYSFIHRKLGDLFKEIRFLVYLNGEKESKKVHLPLLS